MKVIAFIDPPQGEAIEKILRHCGLWQARAPRAPPPGEGFVDDQGRCSSDGRTESSDSVGHVTNVDTDTFLATFS